MTDQLDTAIANLRQANEDLVAAMHAEKAKGTSANKIVARVEGLPGYSRVLVLRLLESEDIRTRALAALADAEWAEEDVRVWRDRQRRVRVTLPGNAYGSRIARMNGASSLAHTLLGVGLRLASDEQGDAHTLLADGEPCYVIPA
ncbi:hypothetical protein [Acrocarpospora sp. B8E8]|uniref:hypothetical protein n=1 Tax=Acrocarpospora sp. B8E8 TaxID=3153572 RepID=UPI00325D6C49